MEQNQAKLVQYSHKRLPSGFNPPNHQVKPQAKHTVRFWSMPWMGQILHKLVGGLSPLLIGLHPPQLQDCVRPIFCTILNCMLNKATTQKNIFRKSNNSKHTIPNTTGVFLGTSAARRAFPPAAPGSAAWPLNPRHVWGVSSSARPFSDSLQNVTNFEWVKRKP